MGGARAAMLARHRDCQGWTETVHIDGGTAKETQVGDFVVCPNISERFLQTSFLPDIFVSLCGLPDVHLAINDQRTIIH